MIIKFNNCHYEISDWDEDEYGSYNLLININDSTDWCYFIVICFIKEEKGWTLGFHNLMKPLEAKTLFSSEQEAKDMAQILLKKWIKLKAFL